MLKRHIALISDVHGNLPALEAVLAHIDKRGIPEIVCLGDLVGYGPHPKEAVDLAMERCSIVMMGNHEEAMIHGAYAFCQRAREAVEWSRDQMKPGWFASCHARQRWKFLERLKLTHVDGRCLLVHGSPRDPTSEYILPQEWQWGMIPKIQEIFAAIDHVCFNGHTHQPGVFSQEKFYDPDEFDEQRLSIHQFDKAIVNVGSVGQPRDMDPDACYVEILGGEILFHRVKYDVELTVEAIFANERLNNALGKRLRSGI